MIITFICEALIFLCTTSQTQVKTGGFRCNDTTNDVTTRAKRDQECTDIAIPRSTVTSHCTPRWWAQPTQLCPLRPHRPTVIARAATAWSRSSPVPRAWSFNAPATAFRPTAAVIGLSTWTWRHPTGPDCRGLVHWAWGLGPGAWPWCAVNAWAREDTSNRVRTQARHLWFGTRPFTPRQQAVSEK